MNNTKLHIDILKEIDLNKNLQNDIIMYYDYLLLNKKRDNIYHVIGESTYEENIPHIYID